MDSPETIMRYARAKASFCRPYFTDALFAVVFVETEVVPAIAIDRYRRIYYNPRFIESHSLGDVATFIVHEIGHALKFHHERADLVGVDAVTSRVANRAQDRELNDDIQEENEHIGDLPPLPDWCCFPHQIGAPNGQVWEVYYEHELRLMQQMSGGNVAETGKGGSGGSGSGRHGNGDGAHGEGLNCGSGAHGIRMPWEHGDPGMPGEPEGVSHADWRDVCERTATAIQDHASRGSVPGGWKDWANEILRPAHVPWEEILAGELRWSVHEVAGMSIYSYQRPSRRQQAAPDFVMPAMRQHRPFVCMIGDSSGSMSGADIALVRGVAEDVCGAMGAQIAFLSTDAVVHEGVQMVGDGEMEIVGGGGTDMGAGIAYAMEHIYPRPDVLLVATDCATPWPEADPGCRVVVAAVGATSHDIHKVPSWATTVEVEPEEQRE